MKDENILRSMRAIAWERAKGELQSMLYTFYTEYSTDGGKIVESNFDALDEAIREFVEKIEDEIGV